jgi:hypothetical protein
MNPVPCVLCNRSVNLTVDLCCDENGKAAHGDCYFNRIIGNSTANSQALCESRGTHSFGHANTSADGCQ